MFADDTLSVSTGDVSYVYFIKKKRINNMSFTPFKKIKNKTKLRHTSLGLKAHQRV